ncbi:MAG: ABC transporter ATP-binding protein [Bacteroidota bacterium]
MPALLSVNRLTKRFVPDGAPVVDALAFDVEPGELFALLGPSGCGKTTALRLIAGFERPSAGTIRLGNTPLVDAATGAFVPPEKRGIGLVFQDYALFPHLDVTANVGFGLRGWSKPDRAERVREVLKLVGLTGMEGRAPHQLSGGQQQRVALARALAPRPHLLLLDEPFSNLDALLRAEMRRDVRAWLQREGVTAILVTHDQEEAMTFADRMAVMQGGRIEQVGTPEAVYHRPRTLFVAQFLGQTNLLLTHADGAETDSVLGHLTLHREAEGTVLVALRPEHLSLTSAPTTAHCREGTVVGRAFRGHDITYRVQLGNVDCLVHTDNRHTFALGDTVWVRALEPAVVLEKARR